jgi:hypothetical protein
MLSHLAKAIRRTSYKPSLYRYQPYVLIKQFSDKQDIQKDLYVPIVSSERGPELFYYGIRYLVYYPSTIYFSYKAITSLFAEYYLYSILYGLTTLLLARMIQVHRMAAFIFIKEIGLVKENGKPMLQMLLYSGECKNYELSSATEADPKKLGLRAGTNHHWIVIDGHLYTFPKKLKIENETLLSEIKKGSIKEYVELNKII